MSLSMALGIVAVVNLLIGYALATWIESLDREEAGFIETQPAPTATEELAPPVAPALEKDAACDAEQPTAPAPSAEAQPEPVAVGDTPTSRPSPRSWASSLELTDSTTSPEEAVEEQSQEASVEPETQVEPPALLADETASASATVEPVMSPEATVARCENLLAASEYYLQQAQSEHTGDPTLEPRAMLADAGQLEMAITSAWENDPDRTRPLCVGQLEIDNIKQLTVDHGAAAVGNLARQVERLVLAMLRRDDLVTSLGRSRFLVVFPNLDGISAAGMLEELRGRLEATEFTHEDVKLRTSMTAAVAQAISAESVDKFLARAAAALADARNAGRNCVAWHDGTRLEIVETSSTKQ